MKIIANGNVVPLLESDGALNGVTLLEELQRRLLTPTEN